MSMRTNRMKAVPTLLKRLATAEKHEDLKNLKSELVKIEDLFRKVKKNEDELLDTLTVVDGYLRNKNIPKLKEVQGDICQRIKTSAKKLLPAEEIQSSDTGEAAAGPSGKAFQDLKRTVPSNPQARELEEIEVNYNKLDNLSKRCFLSLLNFHENDVIKKKTILWWICFVKLNTEQTAPEDSHVLFRKLLNSKLIVPHCNDKSPIVNKFKINPLVHHKLQKNEEQQQQQPFGKYSNIISSSSHSHRSDVIQHACLGLDQRNVKLSDGFGSKSTHWKAVCNVGASYLNFGPGWMTKMEHLEVLQLGHWLQSSPKHHIEVVSKDFLKELRHQKNLNYLSLRGISQIFELPSSILQLDSLRTLDLETVADDISPLRNLTHLDLSGCYLLDKMPKGIEKLTKLEVLKGFVISSSRRTPCRISDLAENLKRLEQLSIHIASGAVIKDMEFGSLKDFSRLEHLKISWGVFDTKYCNIQISLPSTLTKLHLEAFPGHQIPKWLNSTGLAELCITGGKLESMDLGQNDSNTYRWLYIIRLKYLKYLKVDPNYLPYLFPGLGYAELKHVGKILYFQWVANG